MLSEALPRGKVGKTFVDETSQDTDSSHKILKNLETGVGVTKELLRVVKGLERLRIAVIVRKPGIM